MIGTQQNNPAAGEGQKRTFEHRSRRQQGLLKASRKVDRLVMEYYLLKRGFREGA